MLINAIIIKNSVTYRRVGTRNKKYYVNKIK